MPEENKKYQNKRHSLLIWITIGLFILLEFVIAHALRFDGKDLMHNDLCFKYLGCNAGFFGYDALVHLTSGIFEAPILIWLYEKYYNIGLFHDLKRHDFLRNLVILIALITLICFGWEMVEFLYDQFRMDILHQTLFIPGHLNNLVQPSDTDTMGDITFGMLGGIIGGFISFWNN